MGDLNLVMMKRFGNKLIHWVDIVLDFEEEVDLNDVKDIMRKGDYSKLPSVLGFAYCPPLGITLNLAIVDDPDNPSKRILVKHVAFTGKQDRSLVLRMAKGQPHTIDYGPASGAGANKKGIFFLVPFPRTRCSLVEALAARGRDCCKAKQKTTH